MKSFSSDIFSRFPESKKEKHLFEILYQIEQNWDNASIREKQKSLFLSFAKLSKQDDFRQISFENLRHFITSLGLLEKVMGHNRKEADFYYRKAETLSKAKQIPVIAILDNLRSAFNAGSIFRTSECFSIEALSLCGSTPQPFTTLSSGQNKVEKTSMGTSDKVSWRYFEKSLDAISRAKKKGFEVVAVETMAKAVDIENFFFGEKTALVFGNEALGIGQTTLKKCDRVLKIPLFGTKTSLNVAVSYGICISFVSRFYRKKER